MAFGKRAYASLPLNCRSQQEKNVLVIQYERETAEVATCEQGGDFPFECDGSLFGHNQRRQRAMVDSFFLHIDWTTVATVIGLLASLIAVLFYGQRPPLRAKPRYARPPTNEKAGVQETMANGAAGSAMDDLSSGWEIK